MSEMVERALKAFRAKRAEFVIYSFGASNRAPFVVRTEDEGKGNAPAFGPASFEEIDDWIDMQAMRSAIEAMREPTQAMIDAAQDGFEWGPPMADLERDDAMPGPVWRAMIDAALQPVEGA